MNEKVNTPNLFTTSKIEQTNFIARGMHNGHYTGAGRSLMGRSFSYLTKERVSCTGEHIKATRPNAVLIVCYIIAGMGQFAPISRSRGSRAPSTIWTIARIKDQGR